MSLKSCTFWYLNGFNSSRTVGEEACRKTYGRRIKTLINSRRTIVWMLIISLIVVSVKAIQQISFSFSQGYRSKPVMYSTSGHARASALSGIRGTQEHRNTHIHTQCYWVGSGQVQVCMCVWEWVCEGDRRERMSLEAVLSLQCCHGDLYWTLLRPKPQLGLSYKLHISSFVCMCLCTGMCIFKLLYVLKFV